VLRSLRDVTTSLTRLHIDSSPMTVIAERPWWRGAVIYQIYPRSFADANGDGIGDIPGITAHLDHVAALGVDAIWVSPFFTSPMLDFGYDVADFCDVDPIFGTLADFDAMVARAHELGLKVIIDQVYSHTSDQHAWFRESRANRTNAKADWYVWADPKPDGTAPNNWQSIFSGPAWTWDARRRQFYFHNFLKEQPDLNLHNPDVQAALLDAGRFWLDRGVDGFRIDAVLHLMHDPALTDNPPSSDPNRFKARGHDFQDNIHNQGHPGIMDFLRRVRRLTDEYDGVFTVAEVGGAGVIDFTVSCASGEDRLNSAYGFDFLYAGALTPELIARSQSHWPDSQGVGWPTWAFENHDAPRAVSRWAHGNHRDAFLQAKIALFCALRGNIILYQGEELGLDQVDIPYELVRDPEALRNWPMTLSRDGARTPMPWQQFAPHGGFSTGQPWLPLGPAHLDRSVDRQTADVSSLLHFTRAMIAHRKASAALSFGSFTTLTADDALLVFLREATVEDGSEQMLCAFNLSDQPLDWLPPAGSRWQIVRSVNDGDLRTLPPFAAVFAAPES
jgi:alpha-glucosidase